MTARFSGQVALLTGAGDALCLALAQAFVAEDAQVALAGSDGQGGSAAEAQGARYYALDARDALAVQAVLRSIVDQFGRIDIWLHYAGAEQDATVSGGAYNCARAIGPVMQRQGPRRLCRLGRRPLRAIRAGAAQLAGSRPVHAGEGAGGGMGATGTARQCYRARYRAAGIAAS